ncbi:MAG: family 1 glycosylhydrolase [Candidatus Omnitrophica bacterium]|nr:family 1 glycosylhydrolase [Candidatus Omnitrophota bacterium]
MNNPFGVLEFLQWNHPWNNYKYPGPAELKKAVRLMQEAGVGWVRMDFLWEDIEPEKGNFEFAKYDQIVDLLNKNGLQVLGIFDYSVGWAVAGKELNCPPGDNALFVEYAVKVINRYKDRIKYWEVWNEPDSAVYWQAQDGLKSYSALLKAVYLAAKKTDPECQILNGGLANGLGSINDLYSNGAKDYFDILNLHFFESPLHEGGLKPLIAFPGAARKIMVVNGDESKKIWITETGCPGVKPGIKTSNWWIGDNPGEKEQAEWLRKVYTGLLESNAVERIFWAFFRDCSEHWKNGVDYFGLVRWDYSRKPAFESYKECFNRWKK